MTDSNQEHFQYEVRTLNAEFQLRIQRKLEQNASANLREILHDYENRLKRLENVKGSSSSSENGVVVASPYQLNPKPLTKVVHFIRHGHGYHNPPSFCNRLDARLTPLGWKQCFQLRQHLLQTKTPFEVELVVTSPMTRTLETAVGVFGFEKPRDESELMVIQRSADETGPGHPAFYKSRHLPIIAQELCRECLQGNQCDTRRSRKELKEEFPGVDFSKVEYDEDLLAQNVKKEWGAPVQKRARSFAKWLMSRPQSYIAVVSHCAFLSFLIQECCAQLPMEVFHASKEYFQNCELRTFVLSRSDYSTVKVIPSVTSFKPKQD